MSRAAFDAHMMAAALEAAARGRTSPNPRVGAVITRGARIVSVGFHARAGEAHAEVDAIRRAAGDTEGATLYCTLEPCNHHGRTPPCTDALIAAKIGRVVIGCADPEPPQPGAQEKLRAAGIEVVVGVREDEARALIIDWQHFVSTGLPYVVLKAAVTLDGHLATRAGDSQWITGEASRTEAHRMRDRADAVLVGVGTAIADDPALTVRRVDGRDPVRVVLDTSLRTPAGSRLVRQTSASPTWILHGPGPDRERARALLDAGITLIEVPTRDGRINPEAALKALAARDIVRVLAEGGAAVHGALLRARLAQEAAVFVAPKILGDPHGLPLADVGPAMKMSDAFSIQAPRVRILDTDVLFEGPLGYAALG